MKDSKTELNLIIENIEMAEKIAVKVKGEGGRAYYVGGFVRDRLLGTNEHNCDIDIEVHGVAEDRLNEILGGLGMPITVGKAFGIISLKNYNIDVALPRLEEKIGEGHRGFDVVIDSNLGTYTAAKRRDFTVNAIMEDILTGELIDHFGGLKDIENKIIRYVDEKTFVEDPLRVLRACQLASRLEFEIDAKTRSLCQTMDLRELSKERVYNEVVKVFDKASKPSIFFRELDKMGHLAYWFKELEDTLSVEQNPVYHGEGNVFEHTMLALDEGSKLKTKVRHPRNFMFAMLCHDLGKSVSSKSTNGKITSVGHEEEGVALARNFLKRLTNNKAIIHYVENMVKMHMKPGSCARNKSKIKSTNKMFDSSVEPVDLIYMAVADHLGRITKEPMADIEGFLLERFETYREMMALPYVTGQDLIESGLEPGEGFGEVLAFAKKLRLAGVPKESALKQTLRYGRKTL